MRSSNINPRKGAAHKFEIKNYSGRSHKVFNLIVSKGKKKKTAWQILFV